MLTPSEIVQRAAALAAPSRSDDEKRRAPRVPFALLVGGLVVGSLALLLALNTASAANELQRHGLARKDAAVAARLQDLQVRAARSAAPENLARAAADLGMVPAGNPGFVVIGADGRATVLGKPKQATAAPGIVPKPTAPKPSSTTTAPATPTTTPATTPAAPPTTEPPTGTAVPPTSTRGARPSGSRTPTPSTRSQSPTRPASPTSTPTPEITLPGGAR